MVYCDYFHNSLNSVRCSFDCCDMRQIWWSTKNTCGIELFEISIFRRFQCFSHAKSIFSRLATRWNFRLKINKIYLFFKDFRSRSRCVCHHQIQKEENIRENRTLSDDEAPEWMKWKESSRRCERDSSLSGMWATFFLLLIFLSHLLILIIIVKHEHLISLAFGIMTNYSARGRRLMKTTLISFSQWKTEKHLVALPRPAF